MILLVGLYCFKTIFIILAIAIIDNEKHIPEKNLKLTLFLFF